MDAMRSCEQKQTEGSYVGSVVGGVGSIVGLSVGSIVGSLVGLKVSSIVIGFKSHDFRANGFMIGGGANDAFQLGE